MDEKKQIVKSTDWLIKNYSTEEFARMKAEAIKEAEEEIRNKEIEEMANDIWTSCPTPDMNIGEATYTAEKLYIAGYRKASDVAREISQDIIEPLWNAYKNSTCQETVLLVALICETINNQLKKKYESEGKE